MKIFFTTLLFLSVFISAISAVLTQHGHRETFMEIQKLELARNELNEEWGKLQLEQSTWSTDDRVERIAREKLGMSSPEAESIVLMSK